MVLQSVLNRARSTGRSAAAVGVLLAVVATTGAVVGAAPSGAEDEGSEQAAAASPLTGYTVQLGPEERIFGPSGLTDFPYFSERNPSGKLIGFISNNDSYRVTSKNNKTLRDPKVILKRGKAGSFDKCGAWLIGSVYKATATKWIALYHAEAAGAGDNDRCIFSDDSVVASVGRAVSHDAGKTWTKTGQVVTQDDDFNGPKAEDATMGRLIRYGEYLYFFYAASTGTSGDALTRRLHVARSPVADLGEKGTWRKYHCYKPSALAAQRCDFGGTGNEGLGGNSKALRTIDPMARVIIKNTYLNRNIALYASGTRGFRLWVSNGSAATVPIDPSDPSGPSAWAGSIEIYPPVSSQDDPLVDTWDRTKRAKQLYAYPSIVGATGDSNTSDDQFYIYYVKLFPGGDFPERYLMRRKVTLSKANTSGLNRVALTTYFRKSDGRRRTSTERPIQNSFRPKVQEGFLLGKPRTGYHQVFECVKRGKYRLRVDKCADTEKPYRRIGWIRPTAGDGATKPIYICFKRSLKNYWASSGSCGKGARRKGRLGYGLPSI